VLDADIAICKRTNPKSNNKSANKYTNHKQYEDLLGNL